MVGGGIPVAIHSNIIGSVTLTAYPAKLSLGKIISGITARETQIYTTYSDNHIINTYRQTYTSRDSTNKSKWVFTGTLSKLYIHQLPTENTNTVYFYGHGL